MCICVYMYRHRYTYTHIRTHICLSLSLSLYIYIYIYYMHNIAIGLRTAKGQAAPAIAPIFFFTPPVSAASSITLIFETRGVFTFTTGACSGGGRGYPPETSNGLTRNPLSSTR